MCPQAKQRLVDETALRTKALAEASKAQGEEKKAITLQDKEKRTRLTLETQCNAEILALKQASAAAIAAAKAASDGEEQKATAAAADVAAKADAARGKIIAAAAAKREAAIKAVNEERDTALKALPPITTPASSRLPGITPSPNPHTHIQVAGDEKKAQIATAKADALRQETQLKVTSDVTIRKHTCDHRERVREERIRPLLLPMPGLTMMLHGVYFFLLIFSDLFCGRFPGGSSHVSPEGKGSRRRGRYKGTFNAALGWTAHLYH